MNTTRKSTLLRGIILALATVLATGCNLVYKQNINQGNVLDSDDVAELSEGMTKRQVQVLLGSPSIQSPFHSDRWDYMHTFARRGGKPIQSVLTLHFENNRLIAMEGNYLDEDDLAAQALRELEDDPQDEPVQELEDFR